MPGIRASVDVRFWSKVKAQPSGCWEWQGYVGEHGYGQFDSRFSVRAHRAVWLLMFGTIPDNLQVLHRCDNKRCVRPSHLFLGTQKENVIDCVEKGRISRGEQRPQHKVTEAQVREMRNLHASGIGCRRLGAMFGIQPCRAYLIVKHRAWRHVA